MKMARTSMFWAVCAFFMLSLGGCYMGERYIAGEPFSEKALAGLEQGTMTKQDVLQWLGPPLAVARRGSTMTFPPAGMRNEGWEDIQSDVFFELFPANDGEADGRIIYYYHAPQVTMNGVFSILIAGGYTRRIVADQLWILIDERTGKIEAFFLKIGEKEAAASGGSEAPPLQRSSQ